jgi:aminoglycoside 2''-phosphotransferase
MDEPIVLDPYAAELRAQVPGLTVRDIVPLAQGWDSVALLVNGEWVFRFARRPAVARQLTKELLLLPELAPTLPLAVPRIEHAWRDTASGEVRCTGYRLLPGVPLAGEHLTPEHTPRLATQLATFLGALHRFPVAEASTLRVPGGGAQAWREEYERFAATLRADVLPLLDAEEQAWTAELWETYLRDDANFRFAPALIHRDLSTDHILYDTHRASVSAVIDWGDAAIGDPALDFAGLLLDLGEPFATAVLAGYAGATDATFRRRMAFYTTIVPFHELLYGVTTGHEQHIRRGREALRGRMAAPRTAEGAPF